MHFLFLHSFHYKCGDTQVSWFSLLQQVVLIIGVLLSLTDQQTICLKVNAVLQHLNPFYFVMWAAVFRVSAGLFAVESKNIHIYYLNILRF